ncbi:transcriptional regulator [Marinobacterium nitratireducens]|uniref:Transcriptional regulator n=1 Tax=Marinobacterium nitratireducens TaxID=518897 RepID=A0A917ZAL6_9GAMM|nr:Lrp/AsnC family transcriptional regulator [Marinobacterium nitratireducens]GGO79715.1 transcriptional regulator [Marinobacterium nitratireducens]
MTGHKLDRIDRRILELLQQDARLSVADIADRVGLSATPCSRRIKRLEEEGFVARQVVILDPARIGLPMTVLVHISLEAQTQERLSSFERTIGEMPEVMECYLITGSTADYVLKVVVPDLDHYQQLLLNRLTSIDGVRSIISNFVLRQPINRTDYALDHLA